MKIVCISDLHGNLYPPHLIPEADVMVIAGDICPATNHSVTFQSTWLEDMFGPWLEEVPVKQVIGVAGNHDWIFDTAPGLVPELNWKYLHNTSVMHDGVHFYGHPYTPNFFDWAFMPPEHRLIMYHEMIPDGTEILVTHGPPRGHLDTVKGVEIYEEGELVLEKLGCKHLREKVDTLPNLKYHIFGHIHSSHGIDGKFVNASILGERYTVDYEPIVIEV